MMIEFYGIPGSGKSFYANQYKQKLSEEGKAYIDLSRHSGMSIWLKFFYKIADCVVCVLPKYRKEFKHLQEACIGCSKEPVYLPLSLKYCIEDIVLSLFLYDIFRRVKCIVINDEGLLQRIATFAVNYNVDLCKLLFACDIKRRNIDNVFINLPVSAAFDNIKKRNRHVCPMDELSENTLIAYLHAFDDACKKIDSSINSE